MVSREQLYAEVWAEPMTKVAARYAVSSSFLARVCTSLNVPRPARGHWAKCEVGRAPERQPLPEALLGDALEWSRGGGVRRSDALPALPRRTRRLPAPRERPGVHPLLSAAKLHFDGAREKDGYLLPSKRKRVDVFASKDALDRVLATANALFDALEAHGYRVALAPGGSHYRRPAVDPREKQDSRNQYWGPSWAPSSPTVVFVGTLAIGLSLFELSENVEVVRRGDQYVRVASVASPRVGRRHRPAEWTIQKDLPSGRLCLRAYCPYGVASWTREWRESEPGGLQNQVKRIASALGHEAPAILALIDEGKRRAELEHQRREEQFRVWERENAERKRAEAFKASRDELLSIIDAWAEANRIERFFQDAELRARDRAEPDECSAILRRLKHGREMLGSTEALDHFRSWKSPEERESD